MSVNVKIKIMIKALKLERIKKGIKQWRVAGLVGITQTELSHYECGRRRCPANIRYKLAEALQMPVDVLFPEEKE